MNNFFNLADLSGNAMGVSFIGSKDGLMNKLIPIVISRRYVKLQYIKGFR
jgi:hypothetical protein